jgi:putative solute:sodium symporter small subunit
MGELEALEQHDPRVLALKAVLLTVWAVITFGFSYFARDLQFMMGPWPFGYWMAAQGAVLIFIAIVVCYAAIMKRLAPDDSLPDTRESIDA